MTKVIFIGLALIWGLCNCTGFIPLNERKALQTCLFHFDGPADSVSIVGDFNNWSEKQHPLHYENGRWLIQLTLPAGIHHYAFIVDGTKWVVDPHALFLENDEFGKQNGTIIIE